MVGAFHRACDVPERDTPGWPDDATLKLRLGLIEEEFTELRQAVSGTDLPEVADALADLVYVAVGMARVMGITLGDVLAEVQAANLAKVDPATGKVRRRDDQKILKPEGWLAPQIADILADQGWQATR